LKLLLKKNGNLLLGFVFLLLGYIQKNMDIFRPGDIYNGDK